MKPGCVNLLNSAMLSLIEGRDQIPAMRRFIGLASNPTKVVLVRSQRTSRDERDTTKLGSKWTQNT